MLEIHHMVARGRQLAVEVKRDMDICSVICVSYEIKSRTQLLSTLMAQLSR